MGPRWPGHYFYQFEERLPQPQIKCTRRIHLEVRFNLAWSLIRSSIFYRKTLFEHTLTHPMTLFYHMIWLKTVSKGIEQKRWETLRRRAGEIAFVCQNNKRNVSITLASKESLYILEKSMVKVTYVWKIKLSRPWTFDNDSCRLCVISHLCRWSNSELFVDVWLSLNKSIGEFSMICSDMA